MVPLNSFHGCLKVVVEVGGERLAVGFGRTYCALKNVQN